MAAARWLKSRQPAERVELVALGPRTSLAALVAGALETGAVQGLALHRGFASLTEIFEQSLSVDRTPELFCFGLLESFDIPQLAALVAPREVRLEK
jgi:hypothetical protein